MFDVILDTASRIQEINEVKEGGSEQWTEKPSVMLFIQGVMSHEGWDGGAAWHSCYELMLTQTICKCTACR